MRNFIKLVFVLFFLPFSLFAQQPTGTVDTILYSKILIIPYNPMMHLSDADDDIAEYSEKNKEQIRAQFRSGLLQSVDVQLMTSYETYTFQTNVGRDEHLDLETIYGSLNYRMDTVYAGNRASKDTTRLVQKLFGNTKAKPTNQPVRYMNVKLSHPELLAMYSKKFGTDLFLFLNQFEVITHYDDCYDLALKTYRREIKVDYSVFDATGKQVYGDVAVVNFSTGMNDVNEIIAKNFPVISDYIYKHLPPKEIITHNTASN